MDQCYVCLEACENKSPCQCEINVHQTCLENACLKLQKRDCTICKSPINIEYLNIEIAPPDVIEIPSNIIDYENTCIACTCTNIFIFIIYFITGCLGKMALFLIGYQTDLWCFWCIEHLIASLGFIILVTAITKIFR